MTIPVRSIVYPKSKTVCSAGAGGVRHPVNRNILMPAETYPFRKLKIPVHHRRACRQQQHNQTYHQNLPQLFQTALSPLLHSLIVQVQLFRNLLIGKSLIVLHADNLAVLRLQCINSLLQFLSARTLLLSVKDCLPFLSFLPLPKSAAFGLFPPPVVSVPAHGSPVRNQAQIILKAALFSVKPLVILTEFREHIINAFP